MMKKVDQRKSRGKPLYLCDFFQDPSVAALKEENARLSAELREARAQIRNLELQVESIRTNARKAMALLDN